MAEKEMTRPLTKSEDVGPLVKKIREYSFSTTGLFKFVLSDGEATAQILQLIEEARIKGKIREHAEITRMRRDVKIGKEEVATIPIYWLSNRPEQLKAQLKGKDNQ